MAAKTSQASTAESTAAVRIPRVASLRALPRKAIEAINSETVNPVPAVAPPPMTAAHPTGGRSRPRLAFVTRAEARVTPSGLPMT